MHSSVQCELPDRTVVNLAASKTEGVDLGLPGKVLDTLVSNKLATTRSPDVDKSKIWAVLGDYFQSFVGDLLTGPQIKIFESGAFVCNMI